MSALPERLLRERDRILQTIGPRWKLALLATVGRWAFDYLTLLAALAAVGSRPRPALVLLAFCAAQVIAQVPITPGGLGFVEAGMTAMLALAGVGAGKAVLATFAYRLFSYWLQLPLGLVGLALFRRRYGPADARGSPQRVESASVRGGEPMNGDLDAAAADFQRDGACVVRGLLGEAEVARLREGVEQNLTEPSERAIEGGGDAGSGRFFEDFRNWARIPGYEEVIRGSRLGEVAAQLMGSETVRLHHDHLLVKEAGTTIRTPWHQDQPFYNVDGSDTVSFWIPLDPVPRESTLEFVAGSHATRTWYMPRSFFDDRALVFEDGTFEEVPDVEADRAAHTILGWALEPGDAVAFNMLTLHASAGSRNRRRAFSVRLVGDDVRFALRPHPTSPPFPELEGVLAHGDVLDHRLFPRLR